MNLTLEEINEIVEGKLFSENREKEIKGFASLDEAGSVEITFLKKQDEYNFSKLKELEAGAIIASLNLNTDKINKNFILVDNPKLSFSRLIKKVTRPDESKRFIHSTVEFLGDYSLGDSVQIGPNTIIGDGVRIGNNTKIQGNCVINNNSVIGENVKIGAGTVIGNEGYGYVKDENGNYERVPHIGNVQIEDNVEIASNVGIDRAMLDTTRIGENTKINNNVHIAHNVCIGQNTLLKAGSIISGSTEVGNDVIIAPGAVLNSHIEVGDEAFVAMGAVVVYDVEPGSLVMGVPAEENSS